VVAAASSLDEKSIIHNLPVETNLTREDLTFSFSTSTSPSLLVYVSSKTQDYMAVVLHHNGKTLFEALWTWDERLKFSLIQRPFSQTVMDISTVVIYIYIFFLCMYIYNTILGVFLPRPEEVTANFDICSLFWPK